MGSLAGRDAGLWFSSWSVLEAQSQWPVRALLLGGEGSGSRDTLCPGGWLSGKQVQIPTLGPGVECGVPVEGVVGAVRTPGYSLLS